MWTVVVLGGFRNQVASYVLRKPRGGNASYSECHAASYLYDVTVSYTFDQSFYKLLSIRQDVFHAA